MSDLPERLARLLILIPYVRKHPGVHVTELANYLHCPPEAVLADLNEVLMCGVPPYLPDDYIGVYVENGRVTMRFADHFKRPLNLTLREALALKIAIQSLPTHASGTAALARRLEQILPLTDRAAAREATARFEIRPQPEPLRQKISQIERAISEKRELEIEYYTASRDSLTRRIIRPYALVEHRGTWYVVAYCLLRRRELPFRVDRIRCFSLRDDRFDLPPHLDLSKYQRDEMYFPTQQDMEVRLWVHGEIARRVREEVPTKRMQRAPGGHFVMTLMVNRREWILRWVLRHGPYMRVLSPPSLREEMCHLAENILRIYD